MRRVEFEAIRAAVSVNSSQLPDFDALLAAHPGTTLDMLRSIHGQEAARRVRALNGPHRRAARDYATRYARGADALALAAEVDIPVCSLLRLLLETLLGLKPPSSGKALRDPSRVPSPLPPLTELGLSPSETAAFTRERLVADIQRAVAWVRTSRRVLARSSTSLRSQDHICSPLVEMQKAAVGAAYEAKLEAELSSAGIAFASEAALRLDGFARTPDVRLEVPVAVRGRVVYWIDSKASFADPGVHAEKGLPQFQAYVNRYGPGLVIYWMGYVAELDTHPQVQLASAFPSRADIRQLASFPTAPDAEEAAEETPS